MSITIDKSKTLTCKYCNSNAISKFGNYKGKQLYWCKVCSRKFKADDASFRMKTPIKEVSSALNMYYSGMSINNIKRFLEQEYTHSPSTATIYEWVQKYTQYIIDSIKECKPNNIGDTWVADETVLAVDGGKLWLWDIIDIKTRFLLASRLSRSRTTDDAQILINKAVKQAGKYPKLVLTDKLASYEDVFYGKDSEHQQGSPFDVKNNTNLIERWHATLKTRTKVMRGLKNFESALEFTNGFLAYYNYIRPHSSIDKTPAEAAGVKYPYKNWAEIIQRHKPSRKIEILHMSRDRVKLPQAQIGRPKKLRTKLIQSITAKKLR